jgi:hypothetical protein
MREEAVQDDNNWWEAKDDPAVFGPVAVYALVGYIPRHVDDLLWARWDSKNGESMLLLSRDGLTVEVEPDRVVKVERPMGDAAGLIEVSLTATKGSTWTQTRGVG